MFYFIAYLKKILYEITLVKQHVSNLEKRMESRNQFKDIREKQRNLPLPITSVEAFLDFDVNLSDEDKQVLVCVF